MRSIDVLVPLLAMLLPAVPTWARPAEPLIAFECVSDAASKADSPALVGDLEICEAGAGGEEQRNRQLAEAVSLPPDLVSRAEFVPVTEPCGPLASSDIRGERCPPGQRQSAADRLNPVTFSDGPLSFRGFFQADCSGRADLKSTVADPLNFFLRGVLNPPVREFIGEVNTPCLARLNGGRLRFDVDLSGDSPDQISRLRIRYFYASRVDNRLTPDVSGEISPRCEIAPSFLDDVTFSVDGQEFARDSADAPGLLPLLSVGTRCSGAATLRPAWREIETQVKGDQFTLEIQAHADAEIVIDEISLSSIEVFDPVGFSEVGGMQGSPRDSPAIECDGPDGECRVIGRFPEGAISPEEIDRLNQFVEGQAQVRGVATDGAARLLIRVPLAGEGERVRMRILGNNDGSLGLLEPMDGEQLDEGEVLLEPLPALDLESSVMVPRRSAYAFAVYTAPDLSEGNLASSPASSKTITIEVVDAETAGERLRSQRQIELIRPPVVFMHGRKPPPAFAVSQAFGPALGPLEECARIPNPDTRTRCQVDAVRESLAEIRGDYTDWEIPLARGCGRSCRSMDSASG